MTTRLSPLAESAIASTSTLGAVEIDVASAAPIALTKQGVSSPNGLVSSSASTVPLVIKSAVGQTADIQQWQDSNGSVIGRFVNGSRGPTITADCIQANSWGLQFVDAANNELFRFTANGKINTLGPFTSLGGASGVPIVVQGAASQTADLQQWQDSTGASLARIQSSGWSNFPYISVTNGITNNSNSGAWINFQSSAGGVSILQRTANNIACVVQGAASQTADLQQWQNSAGAYLARVDNLGGIHTTDSLSGNNLLDPNASGSYIHMSSTYTLLNTRTATNIGLVVQGSPSQSADLQQWQNSAGAPLAKVDASGSIFTSQAVCVGRLTGDNGYLNLTNPTDAVGIFVRGNAAQTLDLQQWANSAGTALARMDKAGRFASNGVEAVTAGAGANAGATPPAPVVTGSTDMRGLVTWGTGTTPAAGAQVAVTFPTAWAIAPYVVVTPINSATAALLPYVAAATTTGFTISTQAAPAASQVNTTYGVQFHVLG